MSIIRRYGKRRIFIALLMTALLSLGVIGVLRATAGVDLVPPMDGQRKDNVALNEDDDVRQGTQKANVLFLLDTGCPMVFQPTGTMPDDENIPGAALKSASNPGFAAAQTLAAQMLRESTYGHGGMPLVLYGAVQASAERYGRELDAGNNMTKAKGKDLTQYLNEYYSPFDYPNNPLSASAMPYALVFKNADWRQNGFPDSATEAQIAANLMPNDSRMYKLKLVMWRVLNETVLLENLRIGMATTFQEGNVGGWTADFYKSANYGITAAFPYGTGPGWATGLAGSTGYVNGQVASWGINRDIYDDTLYSKDSATWKLVNRGYLRVPIREYSEDHIKNFRLWLNGYEDNSQNVYGKPYYFSDPELFADGKTYLSTAIYSGHAKLNRSQLLTIKDAVDVPGVAFSSRNGDTKTSVEPGYTAQCFNYFKQGSGEAVGTILDFFSPPVANIGDVVTSAHNVNTAPEISFPLRDPCEKNWVIIFTAGDDSSDYSSATAVADLYNYTKNTNLTKFKEVNVSNMNAFEPIKLEDGVRTLVVGFVDPDSTAANVVALRTRLNAMAVAGDPGNPEAKAFFANDVEGLIHALRSVLARINSEIQPAKGSMLEGDSFGDESYSGSLDSDILNLYAGSYRINIYDQWEGSLTRYEAVKDKLTGEFTTTYKWELNTLLKNQRNTTPGSRKLVFWAGSGSDGHNFQPLPYTPITASDRTTDHPIVSTYHVNLAPPIASMDASILPSGVNFSTRFNPSRALIDWYYGKEIAYTNTADVMYDRRSMLSDQGQSGVVKAGLPERDINSLPRFQDFADAMSAEYPNPDPNNPDSYPTQIYFQSNDGVLHVVDSKTGSERMAILPPPSLMPYRLFALKTERTPGTKLYRWINVDGELTTTSDDIPITSIPSFTLDGPTQIRYFRMNDSDGTSPYFGWRSILAATLGRGGGGIYTMDVTNPTDPAFGWYRETYEDPDRKLHLFRQTLNSGVDPDQQTITPDWGDIYANPRDHAFEQLGFNSPAPHFGVATSDAGANEFRNIIALSGGVQNYLDIDSNGAMGSALYLIDPAPSYHESYAASDGALVFNSGSVGGAESKWKNATSVAGIGIPNPYMGMMVAAPVFHASQNSDYIADSVFAGDNRGNIFLVSFVDHGAAGTPPLARNQWKIRTIATLRLDADEPTASYSFPTGVVTGARKDRIGEEWVAGGTSNVGTRGASDEVDTMIKNKKQMIFCFQLPNVADDTSGTPGMTYRGGGHGRPGKWTELDSEDGASEMDVTNHDDGWYIPLRPAGSETDGDYDEEYVTTQPIMFGGNVYIGTFRQKILDTTNSGLCDSGKVLGNSRLYAVEMDSGRASMWNGREDKYLEFDGIKITGFTISEKGPAKTLLITYEILDIATAEASINAADSKEERLSHSSGDLNFLSVNMMVGGASQLPVTSNDGVVNYWLRDNL